jgi:hypothetical protein
MTREQAKHSSAEVDSGASVDLGPAEVLAQKVIAALVEASLVSEGDGESIGADLAAGKVDTARWKLLIENQLERKARLDERK